jgi:predicted NAD-dependent protein-ADP-ribosyltransferase YbiA (DUF1768 family)
VILIKKVSDDWGCLGNMSPHPVEYNGKMFRTTEALFQSLRFDDEEIIEAIRAEKSPMGAKFKAKRFKSQMVVEPLSEQDLDNMRLCLKLKVEQWPQILEGLNNTVDEIKEDCTKRQRGSGLFWGAALVDGKWKGENWLGELWMELRTMKKENLPEEVQPMVDVIKSYETETIT